MTPFPKLKPLLAAAALALSCSATLAQALKVEQAWARPTVQGQTAGGGFLRIVGGTGADRLLGARADISGRVELHTMTMDGDVMRMREVDAIEVPAGRTVELKPGGLHLMFMDLKTPLKAGSRFPLTLRFEKAGDVQVEVPVQRMPPAGAAAGGGHHGTHRH
jgi:copper(I)-binding protein